MQNIPSDLAQKVLTIAEKAGEIALKYFRKPFDVAYKTDQFDPVTIADKEADEFIRKELKKIFPDDSILSEENGDIPKSYEGKVWIVDPLDGTKAFVQGDDSFSVLIALVQNGVPIFGCVTLPAQNKVFYAEKGKGAFEKVGDSFQRIQTSAISRIEEACLISREASSDVRPIEEKISMISFKKRIQKMADAKVCKIARGEVDIHINTNFKASKWDIAAPEVILEEAGGVVSDLDGNPIDYKKGIQNLDRSYVASANKDLHAKIIRELKKLKV